MNSSQNINPKPCNYGCNTRIYWNTSENAYFEVFSGNRHQCPNRRLQQQGKKSNTVTQTPTTTNITTKPNYYSKKQYFATQKQNQQPKPKMSNSLELLQGPIADVQKKYEMLSDIVSEAHGKVHGSQSHIINNANSVVSLIVYYEVPEGQRDEIKHKFNSFVKNLMILQ